MSAVNAYLILDLHGFAQPDNDSLAFWTDAATRYKNNPAVLFGLFNEPHGTTWDVWKNGDATHPGIQALVNTIRATGAKNLAIAGGLDYAYVDTVSQRVLGATVITDSADYAGRFVFSQGAIYAFGDPNNHWSQRYSRNSRGRYA